MLHSKLKAVVWLPEVLLVVLSLAMAENARAAYSFSNVDYPGASWTVASGINDSGQIVGYYNDASGVRHGFLLSAGTYTTIDCPSPYTAQSIANGVNSAGQIVGTCSAPGGVNGVYGTTRSFLLSGSVLTFLPDAPGSYNGASTFAQAINDTGQIVGWYADGCLCDSHGFLLSGGTFTTIDVPGFADSYAYGINNSGQIIGATQPGFGTGGIHGFLLKSGNYTLLDDPDTGTSSGTAADSINSSGKIAGYYSNGAKQHGFLLDSGAFTTVDPPNALGASVQGINSLGQLVGAYTDLTNALHGFVTATPLHFSDDFNRPDGSVGNGWSTWGNGASIAAGELQTFGASGGVFRTLPVTFPVFFAFDFRTAAVGSGSWLIEFNDPNGQQTGTAEFELYGQDGGQVAYYYHTSGGQVGFYGTVVNGQLQTYGSTPAHVSGTVQADLSSFVTIIYADGTHATVSTPAPVNALIAPQGQILAIGNGSAAFGPHFFDNLVVDSSISPSPQAPTVNFTGAPASAAYGSTFTVAATTTATTTATISASGACSVSGTTVTMTSGTGTCNLTANWGADAKYTAASLSQSTAASLGTPTVSFTGAPASAVYGSMFTVTTTTNASTTATINASGACSVSGTTITMTSGMGTCNLTANWAVDANYNAASLNQSTAAATVPLTVTVVNAAKILAAPNPALNNVTYNGFVNGDSVASLGGTLSCTTTATTTSPAGSYAITCTGQTSNNYTIKYIPGTLKILYANSGLCDGEAGHQILQPVNADGTSVWKQGRTIPLKFRVCDAGGVSIGTVGVISSFVLTQIISGTVTTVDEYIDATTIDSGFRFDTTSQQWIFNLSTKSESAGFTYVYSINLNDGTSIIFQYGLR